MSDTRSIYDLSVTRQINDVLREARSPERQQFEVVNPHYGKSRIVTIAQFLEETGIWREKLCWKTNDDKDWYVDTTGEIVLMEI